MVRWGGGSGVGGGGGGGVLGVGVVVGWGGFISAQLYATTRNSYFPRLTN